MTGTLIGIARHAAPRAPIETRDAVMLSPVFGVEGDCKGTKFPDRQVTILAREDWQAALAVLDNPDLPWTTRRANLFTEGLDLPQGQGSIIAVGGTLLEVTEETTPCALMDHFYRGLRQALAPDWRGGVTCRVIEGGRVSLGDPVRVTIEERRKRAMLP